MDATRVHPPRTKNDDDADDDDDDDGATVGYESSLVSLVRVSPCCDASVFRPRCEYSYPHVRVFARTS
eukprot:scaffold438589_cov14-Prasinocladus_malaysianus.AAC.1